MDRDESIESIKAFLVRVGFVDCDTADYEQGFEKVAIYANNYGPQHVARQLPDGKWTSKLGAAIDAAHLNLGVLEDGTYGRVVSTLKRKANLPIQLPPLHPPKPRLIRPDGGVLLR
jgi:hypothetical protein